MTPWQARLIVLGFVLLAAAISTNLLLLQAERTETASDRRKTPESVSQAAVPRPRPAALDRAAGPAARPVTAGQPATAGVASRPDKQRAAVQAKAKSTRPPATTASTR